MQWSDDIVSVAKEYAATQGFPNADYQAERQMLIIPSAAGVMHFVGLEGMLDRWREGDAVSRRKMLERRLLALRQPPAKLTDDVFSLRLLPRLRALTHLSSLALHRQIVERVDQEESSELTLPFRPLTDELGTQLVFELSEEAADVNDARLASWGRPFDSLMKLAIDHLRARSSAPMQQLKPRLYASSIGDGHDAARLLLDDKLKALPIKSDLIAMAPHYDLLLACSANEPKALVEMAKFGLQASQQAFGLPGTALMKTNDGWKSWLPHGDHEAYEPLRMARLPGMSRAYSRQKELLEAWFELEEENTMVAPLIILEDEERLYSGAVWLKGTSSLIPHAERIAFAIPEEGDNARVYPVDWAQAVKLPGIHLQAMPNYSPPRFRATGFPEQAALNAAVKKTAGK